MNEQCRPLLAVIQEDFPKIKNEDIRTIDGTINYLFALLNIQFKAEEKDYRDAQTLVLSDFLTDRFKQLTLEEVKQAFKMYAAKEFPELKTFRILDCIALGEVLNAFIERRNETLHVYNQKKISCKQNSIAFKPSEEEKRSLRVSNQTILFESLKSSKTDYSAFIYYDELKAKGKIDPQDAINLYDDESKTYEIELRKEAFEDSKKRFSVNSVLEKLKSEKWDPVIVSRTKSAVVSKYLRQFEKYEDFLKAFE